MHPRASNVFKGTSRTAEEDSMQNTFVLVHLIAIFVASSHAQAASILHEDFQGLTATGSHVSYPFERESGTYQLFATVAGWTQTGDASQFIKVNGQSGNTSLILNEGGSAPNTISRTIGGLIPGLKYKVTFEHWADLGFGTYTFDWEINGTTFSVVDAGSGQASGNFRAVNYDFVATTDTTLLRFAETSITSTSITLDNIKIRFQSLPRHLVQ
jgi:hypothetical protein